MKQPSLVRNLLCGLAFTAVVLSGAASAASIPAQVPLTSRISTPPAPNVMITIDDSGSMQAHYMPENTEIVNGKSVYMPVISDMAKLIDVMLGDPTHDMGHAGNIFSVPSTYVVKDGKDKSRLNNLVQRQMRAASTNSIFYNPAVLYRPWMALDPKTGTVRRMDDASYRDASWDVTLVKSAAKVDLGITIPWDAASTDTNWCADTNPDNCKQTRSVYDPGLYYVLQDGADPNDVSKFTEYDLNTAAPVPTYPSSNARLCSNNGSAAGCCPALDTVVKGGVVHGCSLAAERQNFANWFVYYRTRTHLIKGGMSEALNNVAGRSAGEVKIRVGWGGINQKSHAIDGGDTTDVVVAGVRDLDQTQLGSVLTGIQALHANGSTPLRQAVGTVGAYFRRDALSDKSSPWRTVPGSSGADDLMSCRRSYMLMTTDGYYNDSPAAVGDVDSKDGPSYASDGPSGVVNPKGYSPDHYVKARPYMDAAPNMLADYAMQNYVNDLQPRLRNDIQPDPNGDGAFWQHLSMFTVGLGVTGLLDPDVDLPALKAGTKSWGGNKIDDLWHAAVDTHGAFFSAKDVDTLTSGLSSAFGASIASSRSESGAAVSSPSLAVGSSSLKYVPGYSAGIWSGTLRAVSYSVDTDPKSPTYKQVVLAKDPTWEAGERLQHMPPASRNIYAWDPGSGPVAFKDAPGSVVNGRVDPNPATQARLINYIRGDRANEGAGRPYRKRAESSVLGDFTDSAPTYVQGGVDLQYDDLGSAAPGYRAYFDRKAKRPNGVVFEGANDGMLHAFKGASGDEVFAYVPYAVMPGLANYASQTYGSSTNFHQNFVDGQQTEADAYIPTRGSRAAGWSNLVLGSFGAGARGLYELALNTDDPTKNLGADTLQWEIAGGSGKGEDPDVGFIFPRIFSGMLSNGTWKAFVGNGVYSVNNNAVLLMVDLATGSLSKLTVAVGSSSSPNGLMGVAPIYGKSHQVVGLYAGDIQGNLWRIDLSGDGEATVGFGRSPLFKAVDASGVPQPIMAAPAVYPRAVGNMVLFGTGKLVDNGDSDSTSTQTFYGVWDNTPAGSVSSGPSPFQSYYGNRSVLVRQTIASLSGAGGNFFSVTDKPVNLDASHLGWYMDLTPVGPRQRVIYAPVVIGQWVLVNTMSPGNTVKSPSCDQSFGTSAYFLLPAESGAMPRTSPVWDVDRSGTVGDAGDTPFKDGEGKPVQAAGYSTTSSGGDTSVISVGNDGTGRNMTGTKDASGDSAYKLYCVSTCAIRRVWRQLMTPPF